MTNMPAALENPAAATPPGVIALQRHYGNRAVRRLLQREVDASVDPSPAPPTGRNLNTVTGLYRHLALLYHPDKSSNPADIPWRSQMMAKLNAAYGARDLAALRRLAAEGAAHSTTTPTTEPSTELTLVPSTDATPPDVTQQVEQNATPLAIEQALTTQPDSTTPEGDTTPTPSGPPTRLRMQLLAHNHKAMPFLKKFMAEQNGSRNFNFYFDTSGNRDLYRKYIADGAAQQVTLPARLKDQLDELARTRSWSGMSAAMDEARAENQDIINTVFLPPFEQSPAYQQFAESARDRPVLTRLVGAIKSAVKGPEGQGQQISNFGPQLPRQMALTRRTVALLDQAITRYTPYFVNGQKSLTEVGLPSDPREVERMFKQGSQRHARVVAAFTRRYALDKTFRKDQFGYGPFFEKLQRFTRLWVEYKTLLKR